MGRNLLLLGLALLAAGFIFWPRPAREYKNLSVAEFDQAVSRDPFIIDVHIPEQDHLTWTDAFIPYDKIGQKLAELPSDKNAEIVLYCRSGSMSAQAAQVLIDNGYTNVGHLGGGIQAWREQHQGILLTPESRALGEVNYGDVAKTEFILTNNTNQMIKLTRVSTSCGCTQAEAEEMKLEPYASTKINVSFDPAVHQDDTDLGEVTRTIFIDTDHKNFSQVEAKITAIVIKNGSL